MTTLPQTTPIRLPRLAGSSQLSVPNGGPVGGVGVAAAAPMSPGDVWRVIRSNMWLIVILLAVSGVGGYFLNGYLARHFAAFSTSALIKIRPVQPIDPLHPTVDLGSEAMEMAQQTQSQMIKSDSLIDDVLKDGDSQIRQTDWWKVQCGQDPQKAHALINEYLVVEPQVGSELIRVAMTTANQKDAPVLVTSIVDRAIQRQRDENRDKEDADRKRVLDLKTQNGNEMAACARDVRDMADRLSRGGGDVRDRMNPRDMQLSSEIERNISIANEKTTTDNAYNSLKSQIDRGETPGRIQAMVDQDRDVIMYKSNVDSYDVSIALDDHGPASPTYQRLQQQREVFQNKLDNIKASKAAQFSQQALAELDSQRQNLAQLLDKSNASVAELKQAIADLSRDYANYQSRRDELEGYRKKDDEYRVALEQIDNKIQMADLGSLAWAARPLEPNSPTFPRLGSTMLWTTLLGLALSLSIAFLRELTDTTVRSPRDILRVGQMTMLGMVPHEADDPQSSGARLPLVIFEAPQSIMAEHLRQVRTRLQHAASLDTTRSILVTSPSPGDGKSTIAVNLAAGLALNGRRILLIDSNFRRPELHRIFGIGNEVGFSDVLNDVNTFASAVRETSVPNLSVMPSGAKPTNSTELLESQLLLDAIERALEEYDHVIFDSGPMLFVSESVALAPRVDGVVTVVRARSSSRGVLTRMREGLRQVKAEHLGVVLNGVRSQAGGYYGRSIKTYYEYQNQG